MDTQELIQHLEPIIDRIETVQPNDPLLVSFATRLLRRVPPDQLDSADPAPTADAIVSLFDFVDSRSEGDFAVRITTPPVAIDGSKTNGSVLEVCSDDRPFLITSVTEELARLGRRIVRAIHPILGARRDSNGRLSAIVSPRHAPLRESVLQIELDEVVSADRASRIVTAVRNVLHDVFVVSDDSGSMRSFVANAAAKLSGAAASHSGDPYLHDQFCEAAALLDWLLAENFTLLGCCDLTAPASTATTTLGIFSDVNNRSAKVLMEAKWGGHSTPLTISQTREISTVDRRVPIQSVDVWTPDQPNVVHRIVGIFTRHANSEPVTVTPILRAKLARVLELEGVVEGSHDESALTALFQILPKDELFSSDAATLRETLSGLLAGEQEREVRVIMRVEPDSHTVSALLTVPKDLYSPALRKRIERFLLAQLDGQRVDVELFIGHGAETIARFVVHLGASQAPTDPLASLEREVRLLCRTWDQDLIDELGQRLGETAGTALGRRYVDHFPVAYRDAVDAPRAASDVIELDAMRRHGERIRILISKDPQNSAGARLEVFASGWAIELSRFLPIVESLGLWVVGELRYDLSRNDEKLHLHDLTIRDPSGQPLDIERDAERLADAALAFWAEQANVDSLNRLVLRAGLPWEDVSVLRAMRRYLAQVDKRYSSEYTNDALVANPDATRAIVALFRARFDPGLDREPGELVMSRSAVVDACDRIERLDHDRILRSFLGVVDATLRTNRYTRSAPTHLSFKFESSAVPGITDPVPYREIFVHSPMMEGIHLRWGAVSRGGIRWSDRRDDYRSEVLDLMRAQVLKNALIVPSGAKGGFVLRDDSGELSLADRVRAAYETFITGLLELTDNVVDGEVVPVTSRTDGDDPYLVVAADKGTAAFSDLANDLSREHEYWLGDAFASGGSHGYDHKALGITARGTWIAVQRHFRELDIDVQTESITVVGIGDMSGDVFGNGMLLSDQIKLVAAFDHRDIFVDPDPDPATTFAERRRLFDQPKSSWQDFDTSVLSRGAGVYSRSLKSVPLSPQARTLLRIDESDVTPAEVISAILAAPVDLLYAGGIGTYVRASSEDDTAILDRANAEVRVVAECIRARVVGEGANLAFTSLARTEYARRGGRINTDFVDNSAGVDISDHEVNIKILLHHAMDADEIDLAERDAILSAATDDVVTDVLHDSSLQTWALSRELAASPDVIDALGRFARDMAEEHVIDRAVEALPSDAEIDARKQAGGGFARPELAVLMAGAKRFLAAEILDSNLADQPVMRVALLSYFPDAIADRFDRWIDRHRLRRELIASVVANDVIDRMGLTFTARVSNETESSHSEVVAAYWIARCVAEAPATWRVFEEPIVASDPRLQNELATTLSGLLEALTRDYLRRGEGAAIGRVCERDRPAFEALRDEMPSIGSDKRRRLRSGIADQMRRDGIESLDAVQIASLPLLEMAPDVASIARATGRSLVDVAETLLRVSEAVGIDRLATALQQLHITDDWQRALRWTILDDLDDIRRDGTLRVLNAHQSLTGVDAVDVFLAERTRSVGSLSRLLRQVEVDRPIRLDAAAVVARAARLVVAAEAVRE